MKRIGRRVIGAREAFGGQSWEGNSQKDLLYSAGSIILADDDHLAVAN